MKRYKIELSEEQIRLIADCLEDVSRFAAGQTNMYWTVQEMIKQLPHKEQMKRRKKTEELLKQVKETLLPELQENESLKYNGTDFLGNTYQIYRTILHTLAIDNNLRNVYSGVTLPSGNMGTIKVEQITTTK